MAEHFIRKTSSRDGKSIVGLTDRTKQALLEYEWPGNIRELENVIERSVILTEPGTEIDFSVRHDMPFDMAAATISTNLNGAGLAARIAETALDGGLTIADLDAAIIAAAVARSDGNLSQAARVIGLSRRQLAYRHSRQNGQS